MLGLPLSCLQRDLWPFVVVVMHLGRENNQTPQGLLNIGSELTQIPRDLYAMWSTRQVGDSEC